MEYNSSEEKVVVDIESGGASGVVDTRTGPQLGKKQGKKLLNKLTNGVLGLNGSTKDEPSSNLRRLVKDSYEPVELLVDRGPGDQQSHELLALIEKKHEKERAKNGKSKKAAAKPPRPPKGPSLDAADMKLVRDISERATKKRERIQRMKALKKRKAAKKSSPSSTSTVSAMIITILFFLVIIFQGLGSTKSLTETSLVAHEPGIETKSLISIEFYNHTYSTAGGRAQFRISSAFSSSSLITLLFFFCFFSCFSLLLNNLDSDADLENRFPVQDSGPLDRIVR